MALEGGEGSVSRPSHSLPPGKNWYQLYRRLGGPQGQSGQVQKISPPPGFDPQTVQPVASHYTAWATQPTHHILKHTVNQIVKWHLVPWNCSLLYQSLMTDSYRAAVEWHVTRENQSALRNLPHCYSLCTNWTWALLWWNLRFHHQKLLANCISYGTDTKWCRNLNKKKLKTMVTRSANKTCWTSYIVLFW